MDLVDAAHLDDEQLVGQRRVGGGADLQAGDGIAIIGLAGAEAKLGEDQVRVGADPALVGLEVTHEADRESLFCIRSRKLALVSSVWLRTVVAAADARRPAIERRVDAPRFRIGGGFGDGDAWATGAAEGDDEGEQVPGHWPSRRECRERKPGGIAPSGMMVGAWLPRDRRRERPRSSPSRRRG